MKKVVFLIGMMVGFTTTVFGQYDVVTVGPNDDFDFYDTWYQVKGSEGEYYFFGEESDETMAEYVVEYLEYMGGDVDNPTKVEDIDGVLKYIYEGLDGDGTNSTVMIIIEEGVIGICKVEN